MLVVALSLICEYVYVYMAQSLGCKMPPFIWLYIASLVHGQVSSIWLADDITIFNNKNRGEISKLINNWSPLYLWISLRGEILHCNICRKWCHPSYMSPKHASIRQHMYKKTMVCEFTDATTWDLWRVLDKKWLW